MKLKKFVLNVLAGFVSVCASMFALGTTAPPEKTGNELLNRVARVQQVMESQAVPSNKKEKPKLAQWYNWPNWGNWNDWRDWPNWNNWYNWVNY
jgi:hypothetical protein